MNRLEKGGLVIFMTSLLFFVELYVAPYLRD